MAPVKAALHCWPTAASWPWEAAHTSGVLPSSSVAAALLPRRAGCSPPGGGCRQGLAEGLRVCLGVRGGVL